MKDNLVKKARALRDLRIIQRRLATTGHHDKAVALYAKVQQHSTRVVLAYLGVTELPDTVNAAVVGEIAEVAATKTTREEAAKLRGLLRRAAWDNKPETTFKLFHAKAQLPNLQKVERVLGTVKE